jgi:putative ABC transport system substrate-binding protein
LLPPHATLASRRLAGPYLGRTCTGRSRQLRWRLPFATLAHEHPDALFVAGDAFFLDRRVQFATLTARDRIPATYSVRELVAAGGLMSYGPDLADVFHHVDVYTGSILKGAKPADLPVVQSTKLEFVINLQTARALGVEVPPGVLSITDEVIE